MTKLFRPFFFILLFAHSLGGASLFEDTVEKVLSFSPSEKLFLEGTDGSVRVYGSSRSDLKITATRKAFSPARLNALEIRVKKTSDATRVSTIVPSATAWHDHSGTVDYIIEIPQHVAQVRAEMRDGEIVIDGLRGESAAVSLRNGRVTSRNCFCNQSLRARSGGIDIIYEWEEEHTLTLEARIDSGNIFARIPAETSFHLRADAPRGQIANEFSEKEDRPPAGRSSLEQSIGDAPQSQLSLCANEGNIHIAQIVW